MFCGVSPEGFELPVYRNEGEGWADYLQRAKKHLAENDERAATAYARAAFESRIKRYCEDKRVAVRYKTDPQKVPAEWLWQAIKDKAVADGKTSQYQPLFSDIDAYRKIVLNPLSHSGSVPVTRTEIDGAIKAVEALAALK